MTDIFSHHEIVTSLCGMKVIDKGTAHRLEQRIKAWANSRKAEGRPDGIAEAARKANLVVAGIKSASGRAAAQKMLRAVEKLLPQGPDAAKEAYARGYTEGVADERQKMKTRQPNEDG